MPIDDALRRAAEEWIAADPDTSRTRIATIHLQILGDAQPEYQLTLVTAADVDGRTIPATLNLQTGENQ